MDSSMPASSSRDLALVVSRPPRRFVVDPGALVNRGLATLRPRRIDIPKAAAALVRQVSGIRADSTGRVNARILVGDLAAGEAEKAQALLDDVAVLHLAGDSFPGWLDDLEGL